MGRTMRWRRAVGPVSTAMVLLAACGGSGSTGLIHPEAGLLAQVRDTGECVEADGIAYCPAFPSDADPGAPAPGEPPFVDGEIVLFVFDTHGLEAMTCAVASRTRGQSWQIDGVRAVAGGGERGAFSVTAAEDFVGGGGALEAVLLCFDAPPDALPGSVDALAEAGPQLVLVAPAL